MVCPLDASRPELDLCENRQAQAAVVRLAEVQHKLQSVVDELLGDAIPPDQPLMEAGLDSVGDLLC